MNAFYRYGFKRVFVVGGRQYDSFDVSNTILPAVAGDERRRVRADEVILSLVQQIDWLIFWQLGYIQPWVGRHCGECKLLR